MKRRTFLVVLLAALALLWLARPFFNREPEYRGRKLNAWFKQYYRSGYWSRYPSDARHEHAARALRAMGTNAVPFLVTECFRENSDSAFKTNVLQILATLPEPIRFPPFVSAMAVREEAAQAIGEIKPPASLLLPLVTNRLNDPNQLHRWMATYLLGYLGDGGEAAVPLLVRKLSSTDPQELSLATLGLDRLGLAAGSALPHLIEFIRTNDSRFRYYPSRTLARLGPAASNAIPVLQTAFADETNFVKKVDLAVALICIDNAQVEALSFLQSEARKTNANQHTIFAVRHLGTNARPLLPLVREACKTSELTTWHTALYALSDLGETNLAISTAMEKLQQNDGAGRYNAMTFLLRTQPTNSAAMSNLVVAVNELTWGRAAIDESARLGALAEPVIPRLREIAGNRTNPHREAAREALACIEADIAEQRERH